MEQKSIFVVSDSTGETAERVVRAALLQYPSHRVRVRLFTRVRDRSAVEDVLGKAAEAGAMVVFTIVAPELRNFVHERAAQRGVEAVDVIGGLIHKVGSFLEAVPLNMPTATLPLSEEYFRRVEAIEFAVKSDDGKEPRNLRRADLVLTGVSRTSKTPLSTYLAGRGLRVANVPLVLGVPPPRELFEVPDERVIGLTIDLDKLLEIRRQRLVQLGMPPDTAYGLREHVRSELEYAHEIFRQHPGWAVVDVSGRAIEETATIILEMWKDREERRAAQGG
ncbi:MAG: kinase/pyrophosphorylase [Myxococcota bacterium]|nr:kinase/pyrophosphorylase [Myxococcota bacterium]MDW8360766.1 pyruvate, water dikinase regulatory protein [Myxococcales bacterium]